MTVGLRGKLVLALGVLALFAVGGSLLAVERYLLADTRARLAADLLRARGALSASHDDRLARRVVEAQLIADEPRLKAVVRTAEVDRATLEDVMHEMRDAARADVFALADMSGGVVADVSDRALPRELRGRPGFTAAQADGHATALWADHDRVHEVVLQVLQLGQEDVGLLVTGYRIDDRAAASLRRQLGVDVVLASGQRLVATALSRPLGDQAVLARAPAGPSEATLGGEHYLVHVSPHPEAGDAPVRTVLLASLDVAYAAHRVVRRALLWIGALALCGALALALVLSRNLTRRLEALSRATGALGRGDLSARSGVTGADEVGRLGQAFDAMTGELARSRQALADKEALEREMEIARRIQTALLPASVDMGEYRVAGRMVPAAVVGGDFYDVICCRDGTLWLAIGDVTSHGVTPGLIMMMAQSALSTLTAHDPALSPTTVLEVMNRVIYANVHDRLRDDNYMTLTILRTVAPGRFAFAGAHLDIAIRRAATGVVEFQPTPGAWTGVLPEIHPELLQLGHLSLEPGDLMLLFTDGLTEAQAPGGAMFGNEGVARCLALTRGGPAEACVALLEAARAHMEAQDDDITVLALERVRA